MSPKPKKDKENNPNNSNSSNSQLLFSQKHTPANVFEIKIQQYYLILEREIEIETNPKNITKITDALIMLDTLNQLIKKQPYEKWGTEALKILSSIDDSRANALADEIDNAIIHSSPSFSQKK